MSLYKMADNGVQPLRRIFNRALSDAEIERLRHEFTPTED